MLFGKFCDLKIFFNYKFFVYTLTPPNIQKTFPNYAKFLSAKNNSTSLDMYLYLGSLLNDPITIPPGQIFTTYIRVKNIWISRAGGSGNHTTSIYIEY